LTKIIAFLSIMLNRKKAILGFVFLLAVTLYVIFGLQENKDVPALPVVHTILGQEESCLQCHGDVKGLAPVHNPEVMGCTPCHLGQPMEMEKEAAHQDMVLIPGNLSDVRNTCGAANCHPAITDRIEHSLMTTMSGVISVDRFVFGELDVPEGHFHIKELGNTAADTHLRQLCASCHLGNQKEELGPITELSRGGGCNACHLNYSKQDPGLHPALSIRVQDEHCFGCHSRSSRISLNYEGWHETHLTAEEVDAKDPKYRLLQDGRVVEYVQEDVHHRADLSCIDCHHVQEVMGDGKQYQHKEEALKIQCADCHTSGAFTTIPYTELDTESKKLLALRNIDGRNKQFILSESGLPLVNAWVDHQGNAQMRGKNNGRDYSLPPPASLCVAGGGHDRLDCGACHTSWAPQCIGCHNTFEPGLAGYDLLAKQPVEGRWVEHIGLFFSDLPTLGVVESVGRNDQRIEEIKTFISGMVVSVDRSGFEGSSSPTRFHRLYAPTTAHTISATGRSCQSCHNNPLALGYGRGKLTYETDSGKGFWRFESEYADSEFDGLPEDAWIGFLKEPTSIPSTRPNARPFSIAEQHRMLTVGACLTCHESGSEVMVEGVLDFEGVVGRKSEECVLPVWDED
jgi:hypothetical protein